MPSGTRNEGFIRPQHRELVQLADGAENILRQLKAFRPPNRTR